MAKTVEDYHNDLLAILAGHRLGDGLNAGGHQAIRAMIEEIHDQGYVLGQLHADGIFGEGEEVEVAEREDRLGIPDLKNQARARAVEVRGGQQAQPGLAVVDSHVRRP